VLDRPDDDVADAGVATAGATEHADAENLLGTRVVGDPKPGLLLDHLLGLLEDLDDPPALGRGQRTRLHEQDAVADTGRVGLVVRLDLGGPADRLAVTAVLH